MENQDIAGIYHFRADSFRVDCTGRLSVSELGMRILQCASLHAGSRDFGFKSLEHHYAWVVSKMVIEMDRMPETDENYTIITWVENVGSYFTNRNYEIEDGGHNVIGHVHTVWALLDIKSRKPVDLKAVFGEQMEKYILDRDCPVGRIRKEKVCTAAPAATFKVKYSDTDVNGHFNSVRYIEHILDLFPGDFYRKSVVRHFEITYIAECYESEEILLYMQQTPDTGNYMIEAYKSTGEIVCKSVISFGVEK